MWDEGACMTEDGIDTAKAILDDYQGFSGENMIGINRRRLIL
jgi:hypothetical protein